MQVSDRCQVGFSPTGSCGAWLLASTHATVGACCEHTHAVEEVTGFRLAGAGAQRQGIASSVRLVVGPAGTMHCAAAEAKACFQCGSWALGDGSIMQRDVGTGVCKHKPLSSEICRVSGGCAGHWFLQWQKLMGSSVEQATGSHGCSCCMEDTGPTFSSSLFPAICNHPALPVCGVKAKWALHTVP